MNFEAFFGATKVYGLQNATTNGAWVHFTFDNLTASSTSTLLKFSSRNDPSFTRLDNVSVLAAPVPEPETYAMMIAGLGLLAFAAKRRKA